MSVGTAYETQRLIEYVATAGQVDVEQAIVRNVKVLGWKSKNGRAYSRQALERAVAKYESVPVYIDHGKRPEETRSYRDRFGTLVNARLTGSGIIADLRYNPSHTLASQFKWDSSNNPQACGLSHAVEAKVSRRNGTQTVESIDKVYSVDLVSAPATTAGLYEQVEGQVMVDSVRWESMTEEQFVQKVTDKMPAAELEAFVDSITEEERGGPVEW